jgi:hypothetical protein
MMCVRITLSGISGMAWTRKAYLLQTCVVEEELHPPAGENAKRKFQNAPHTCMMSVHSNLWNHCDASLCSYTAVFLQIFYKLLLFPFYSIAVHRPKQQQGRPSIERERERERERYNKTLSFRRMHEWPLLLQKSQKGQQQKNLCNFIRTICNNKLISVSFYSDLNTRLQLKTKRCERRRRRKQKMEQKRYAMSVCTYVCRVCFLSFLFFSFPSAIAGGRSSHKIGMQQKLLLETFFDAVYNNHNMKQAAPSFFCFRKLKRVQNNNNVQQQQQQQTATECGGMLTFWSAEKTTKTTTAACKVSEELNDMRRK